MSLKLIRILKKTKFTIRQKIILLSIISTLIPLSIIGGFSFYYSSKIIGNKISETNSNFLSVINWNIDTFVSDIESIGYMLLSSNGVQSFLSNKNYSRSELYRLQDATRDVMINITNNKPYISAIYVGNESQEYLNINSGESSSVDNVFRQIRPTTWYDQVLLQNGKGIWLNNERIQLIKSRNILTYGKLIRDLDTLETRGILIVTVDHNVFGDMFKDLRRIDGGDTLILEDDRIVYHRSPSDQGTWLSKEEISRIYNYPEKGTTIETFNDKKYMIDYATNEKTKWKIVSIIPYEHMAKELALARNLTTTFIIFSFVLAVMGALLISNKITQQLSLLKRLTKRIAIRGEIGDIYFKDTDEIGRIGNQFIRILGLNQELNKQVYESKIKEKEAELMALQSQINPHFLYNTLNSIFWMAEKIKAKNISKMVINLSKIFRLSLNNGNYITNVSNEIEHVRNYLEIQNIRYDDKLDVSIDIDPSILEEPMLKLLLQPLVENAIYHGIEPKEGKGEISITGRRSNQGIVFEVVDDGIGFDVTTMEGRGYALRNIQERIQLHYGPEFGLAIESKPHIGTKATIQIGII